MSDALQRGTAAFQARNFADAAQWFEKALQSDPDDIQARMWLGQSLCLIGRTFEGTGYLREAGKDLLEYARDDGNTKFVLEIVQQLEQANDFSGAYDLGVEIIKLNPNDEAGFRLHALACSQLNKKEEALAAGEQAMKLAPANTMMHVLLGSLEADAGKNDAAKQRLEAALKAGLDPRSAFRAHKELARVLDKLGRFAEVFPHLHESTKLAASLPEYGRQGTAFLSNLIATNKSSFDRALLGRWSANRFPTETPAPVFLVGFYRSGTTLTQEVLAAHPEVSVADENNFVWAMQQELNRHDQLGTVVDKLRRLDVNGVIRLRNAYWRSVREKMGDVDTKRVFVDKFTMNTVDLGLINCIFPDAKIIFVLRDPRDVCLSSFMQLMVPTPATANLVGWESTAGFYSQVMDWWMHIKPLLTAGHIEFRYEDAVADFEATYRRVFDFLGLTWDPAVIKFHERAAKKFIASPSRNQVAQPLYSSSVSRWRHYASEFPPIAAKLERFIDAFGYGRT